MQKNILFVALLLISFTSLSYTHETEAGVESNLIILTEENFNNYVDLKGEDTWFIMFYAPWCGHCKRALPAWTEFSVKSKGKLNVATVNCDEHKNLRDRFGVQGFPTFLLVKDNTMTPYKGPRTIEEWTKFVEGGYKDAKPEEIPTGPSVLKNIERFIEGIANEMMRLYKNDFTIFAVIVGVLGVTCFLTCWCAAKLGSDDDVSEGPNPNVVPKPTESSESKPPAAEGGDKKEKKD